MTDTTENSLPTMNAPASKPNFSVSTTDEFTAFSRAFLVREDAVILLAQLTQLVKAAQRHRGISMGMLAGNTDFHNEFELLQRQLERRLAMLQAFAQSSEHLTVRDKENLSHAWQTIRSNWEGDKLSDNFELHSHFIEQLVGIIAGLAKKLEAPLLASQHDESFSDGVLNALSKSSMCQQAEILNFIGRVLPETIEQVARIRGFSAYAVVVGSLDGLDERKIRYWVKALRQHSNDTLLQALTPSLSMNGVMSSLSLITPNEQKLLQFLDAVESALFKGKGGRDQAHELFNAATDIIEIYWEIVAEGLTEVQAWHRRALESWVFA